MRRGAIKAGRRASDARRAALRCWQSGGRVGVVPDAEEMLGLLDAWGIPRARRLVVRGTQVRIAGAVSSAYVATRNLPDVKNAFCASLAWMIAINEEGRALLRNDDLQPSSSAHP